MTEPKNKSRNPAYTYPRGNTVYLGEDAYSYLPIHCPFCGARSDASCQHRLAVLDATYFTALNPAFSSYLRRFAGLQPQEDLSLTSLLPPRLWRLYHNNEGLLIASVKHLNALLPGDNGVILFMILNKYRLDQRTVVFGNQQALTVLQQQYQTESIEFMVIFTTSHFKQDKDHKLCRSRNLQQNV